MISFREAHNICALVRKKLAFSAVDADTAPWANIGSQTAQNFEMRAQEHLRAISAYGIFIAKPTEDSQALAR
jgi:hypothetical protein